MLTLWQKYDALGWKMRWYFCHENSLSNWHGNGYDNVVCLEKSIRFVVLMIQLRLNLTVKICNACRFGETIRLYNRQTNSSKLL